MTCCVYARTWIITAEILMRLFAIAQETSCIYSVFIATDSEDSNTLKSKTAEKKQRLGKSRCFSVDRGILPHSVY